MMRDYMNNGTLKLTSESLAADASLFSIPNQLRYSE